MPPNVSVFVYPFPAGQSEAQQLSASLQRKLGQLGLSYELIGGDRDCQAGTGSDACSIAEQPDYGIVLRRAIEAATGEWLLCLGELWLQELDLVTQLWELRAQADIIVGPHAAKPLLWFIPAIELFAAKALDIRASSVFSSFRLCRSHVLKRLGISGNGRDVLPEMLVRAYADGWRVLDASCGSGQRLQGARPGYRRSIPSVRCIWNLWMLRNSIQCADYDGRAYDSRHPFQRYWQRRRYAIVTQMVPKGSSVLDIGCGSSRILAALGNAVGLDIQMNKLRYAKHTGSTVVNADAFSLPFGDASFDCVLCSQVIEHLPEGDGLFSEMARVLKPEGRLIIGTPDYGSLLWPAIERVYKLAAPNAYADEHITHYTHQSLELVLSKQGFAPIRYSYVFHSELIIAFSRRNLAHLSASVDHEGSSCSTGDIS